MRHLQPAVIFNLITAFKAACAGGVLHNCRMATAVCRVVLLALVCLMRGGARQHGRCGAPRLPSSSAWNRCRPGCGKYCSCCELLWMVCCAWSWGVGPTLAGWASASWSLPSGWRLWRLIVLGCNCLHPDWSGLRPAGQRQYVCLYCKGSISHPAGMGSLSCPASPPPKIMCVL
jgi:hypothetical protein